MLAYALASKPCSEATNIGGLFSSGAVFGKCFGDMCESAVNFTIQFVKDIYMGQLLSE